MRPRQRHALLGAAFAGAAWLAVFGDTTPDDAIAPAVVRDGVSEAFEATAPRRLQGRDAAPWPAATVDLFVSAAASAVSPVPPGPASEAAALPFTAIGREGQATVLLHDGEDVVQARVGTRWHGYRVVRVETERVRVREIATGHEVSLATGGPDGVFDGPP
ncbi:hypothetical protein [Piscinibacter gummiphilus]|uniref:Uncharacterized protein n=1 Tax=Piscinibacter gummiphilus TaxID=946333 RepID=A0A1W6LGC6_9BURK|nr:hypothetical protein [Piscinibacter gummiphilus]ARN23334.1 hypothetical protein A4W93_27420 [Piscinibacter gummiphilus]ATU68035.1 hypothetical protein CPZ87_27545 [Piscinibacter gummiphilus]GLS97333.1 hypothetical protein GCM10007918_46250 [Piscinibacter gummiphilus]